MNRDFACPTLVAWYLLLALMAIGFAAGSLALAAPALSGTGPAAEVDLPPGNPERKVVLDILREELRRYQHPPAVFIVRYLRVSGGWAWITADPQSPDGTQHYEPVSALLRKHGGVWTLVEMPCTEEENPECITDPGYFARLRSGWPDVPPGILPVPE